MCHKEAVGELYEIGGILLSTKLIQVLTPFLDCVTPHELCHLKEHYPTSASVTLLDQVLPGPTPANHKLDKYESGYAEIDEGPLEAAPCLKDSTMYKTAFTA